MGSVFATKEACVFVGGNGTKAGVAMAGGCTRAWLESKGMNPSSLFGSNGSCKYQASDLEISMSGVINGSVGQFSGIEPGMAANITSGAGNGMFEVTAVGSQGQSITFGGWNFMESDTTTIYIGGAFNGLYQAMYYSYASSYDCYILSNKDETITANMDLRFTGGNPQRNTWKRIIGYNQNLYLRDSRIVSDMDAGEVYSLSAEQIMQNGIGSGYKVTINGAGFSGIAVSWKVDNLEMRHFRIIGNAGGSCLQPASGTALQYKGLILKGCVFEGGQNGLYSNGLADFVYCEDCYAAPSITGWGFYVLDSSGSGRSVAYNDCIANGCGSAFATSGGSLVDGCIGRNNTVGMMTNGEIQVRNSLLYNCSGSAFECNSSLARWHIWNTIAVMSNTAQYGIFRVQANGGNIVYEDYNCFVKLDGTAAVYHYSGNWPTLYSPSLIGKHTIQKDPCFMDAVNMDFRLRPNSPCLNAGRPTLCSGVTSIGVQQKMQIPPRNVMYGANNRLYGL